MSFTPLSCQSLKVIFGFSNADFHRDWVEGRQQVHAPLQNPLTVTPLHDEPQTPGMPSLQACPESPAGPVDGLEGVVGAGPGAFKQQTLSERPLHAPVTVLVLHEFGLPQTPSWPFLQGSPGSPTTPLGAGVGGSGFGAGVASFKQQTLSGPPLQWPLTVDVLHEDGLPQMPSWPFLQISPGSPVIPCWSLPPSDPLSSSDFTAELQTAASA